MGLGAINKVYKLSNWVKKLNPIAYYRFENDANDYVGNNHGVIGDSNQVLFEPAKIDNGVKFIGGNANSKIVVSGDNFDFTDGNQDKPFSISFWVKLTTDSNQWFISKRRGNANRLQWQIIRYQKKISVWIFDNDNKNWIRSETNKNYGVVGEWLHIAATYDGSGSENGVNLYINGDNSDTYQSLNGNYQCMKYVGEMDMWIGNTQWQTSSFRVRAYIDELGIFGKELKQDEVLKIYNSTKSLF